MKNMAITKSPKGSKGSLPGVLGIVLVGAVSVLAADLPTALIDPYLRAQTLLSTDKTDGLAAAATAIETAAAPLGKDGAAIVAGAKKLGAAKTIVEARAAFGELSVALVNYAEKGKAGLGAGLHVAYCPMADKPWVQKGTEIKNPYYGSEMLSCGSIKK